MLDTRIYSYEHMDQIKADLTEALEAGTLTDEQLVAAIHSLDSVGTGYMLESVGLTWILKLLQDADDVQRDLVAEKAAQHLRTMAVEQLHACIPDMESVFRACFDHVNIAMVLSTRLLRLVETPARAAFMRDLLAQRKPHNTAWIGNCRRMDIPREAIAETIIDMLRRSEPSDHRSHSYLAEFLDNGAGKINDWGSGRSFADNGDTSWSILTDKEFIEAMRICIDKAPAEFFYGRPFNSLALVEKLEMRLSAKQVEALLVEAAGKLTSLAGVPIEVFRRLPLTERMRLIEELPGTSLEMLVDTTARTFNRFNNFDKYSAPICVMAKDLPTQFCRLQPLLTELREESVDLADFADHVDGILVNNLRPKYLVGTITQQTHQGRTQFCVVARNKTYVKYTGRGASTDYHPRVGDRVVFWGQGVRDLVPGKVTAVTFLLVSRAPTTAV